MSRKFIKKARPFGEEERPPAPPAMKGPGGGAPPPGAPPGPGANSAPGGAVSPSKAPAGPGGPPAPPGAAQAPHDPSNPVPADSAPKPRTPGGAPGAPGGGPGGNTPTDVQIDAATGHITIKKGPINFTIAQKRADSGYGTRVQQAIEYLYDVDDSPESAAELYNVDPQDVQRAIDQGGQKAYDPQGGGYDQGNLWFGRGHINAAGEWPPAGMDQSWAPEEQQFTDPGTPGQMDQLVSDPEAPSNFEEEPPPTGAFTPGESIKYTDPDTGRERYGIVVELKENGLYTINFDDGTNKDLHEGWLMAAPEAPNADDQYNNYQQPDMSVAARIERAFFPKQAETNPEWIEFKHNDKEPQYGDWGEGSQYSEDRWDSPFAVNKNRRTPPLFTVKATVPDYHNPRSIAYALQTQLNKDVDVSGTTLTIKDVEQPWSLITELGEYGIDAKTTEDLTKFDQGVKDFKQGMKVAVLGDFPDMNYYYDETRPAAQAHVVQKTAKGYILENDQWGRFLAEEREIDYVRS